MVPAQRLASSLQARTFREKLSTTPWQVGARLVEKPNDRHVDVEPFAGVRGSNSNSRLRRIESTTGPAPTMLRHHSTPGLVAREDTTAPLCQQSKRAKRKVLVFIGLHHHSHRPAFFGCQSTGDQLWGTGARPQAHTPASDRSKRSIGRGQDQESAGPLGGQAPARQLPPHAGHAPCRGREVLDVSPTLRPSRRASRMYKRSADRRVCTRFSSLPIDLNEGRPCPGPPVSRKRPYAPLGEATTGRSTSEFAARETGSCRQTGRWPGEPDDHSCGGGDGARPLSSSAYPWRKRLTAALPKAGQVMQMQRDVI